jgi:hypothetical protein
MVKLIWQVGELKLDQRTFTDSLSAQRFVRKKLSEMPQCHAKWQPGMVLVLNGAQTHSTFILKPVKE